MKTLCYILVICVCLAPGWARGVTPEELGAQDMNGDGVWDDVEDYISSTYPGSEELQHALRQMAGDLQEAMLHADSKEASVANAHRLGASLDCLSAIRPIEGGRIAKMLVAYMMKNNGRGRAYLRYNSQLGGTVFPLGRPEEWVKGCRFPVKGQ